MSGRQQQIHGESAAAVQLPEHHLAAVAVAPVEVVAAGAAAGGDGAPTAAGVAGGGIAARERDLDRCAAAVAQCIAQAGATQVDAVDRGRAWDIAIVVENRPHHSCCAADSVARPGHQAEGDGFIGLAFAIWIGINRHGGAC